MVERRVERIGTTRARAAEDRRHAIVAAGLDEFAEKGFSAARLEDVASRAGVAKGTIYLHFADKQALFLAIVQETIGPVLARILDEPPPVERPRDTLRRLALGLAAAMSDPDRAKFLRLLLMEAPRFPTLGALYHREVVAKALARIRDLARKDDGPGGAALARHPNLLAAPALMGLVWRNVFADQPPLDLVAQTKVQLDLLFPPDAD